MKYLSYANKTLNNPIITGLTALTLLTGITRQADAAIINFDAETYEFSNPNTCTPQLPNTGGRCFVEDGVNVEAFSAQKIGSSAAFFSEGAHFHSSNSYEAQHFSAEDRLLGVYLTLVNGGRFSLASLDYQLRDTADVINGFPTNNIKMLISPEFDPTKPVTSQFTEISLGSNTALPFETLVFSEFDDINQVYIASSGGVNFDNIDVKPVPEPSTILGFIMVLGSGGILKRKSSEKV